MSEPVAADDESESVPLRRYEEPVVEVRETVSDSEVEVRT